MYFTFSINVGYCKIGNVFYASEIHLNIFWHMEAETEYIFNFRASLFTTYIEYVFK